MDKGDTSKKIPLIYAYLYMKIKKQMRGGRITGSNLRKVIQKTILCDKGGGTKGIPRRYGYDIIKDLVNLNLIENTGRVNRDLIYEAMDKNLLEVSERLKDWKIDKVLRDLKNVQKELGPALKILDEDNVYRVVKSKCDKELKQAFW